MIVHIEVTQQDIDDGKRSNCNECPIALAASRALKDKIEFNYVHVNPRSCGFWKEDDPYFMGAINLPPNARAFVHKFDNDIPVKPFKFSGKLVR